MKKFDEVALAESGLLPPLVADYINGADAIRFLYKYQPDIKSFRDVIRDKSTDKINRTVLRDVLLSQYGDIPLNEAVKRNIEALADENTFTVTAAHQPCLFLGPLYNVVKIACAINLSQQLAKEYPEQHFIPVFWLGSEDHDTEELNHAFVSGRKVEWDKAGSGACGRWNTEGIQHLVEELKSAGISENLIATLTKAAEKFTHFGKLSQFFVHELFKEFGLVVIDQDDEELKKLFTDVAIDEVLHSRAGAVLSSNVEFLEAHYKAQAKPREINFFYLGKDYRERMIRATDAKSVEVNNRDFSFPLELIADEIKSNPKSFSPNVIFRPLYQEMILPNLAFIGGGGEISYWLVLKPLFDYYKVNFPMLVLRNSAVILSGSTKSKMDKLGLAPKDLFGDIEALIKDKVRETSEVDLDLSSQRNELEKIFDEVSETADKVDATLVNNVAAEKQKALQMLQNIEAKMVKAQKRKHDVLVQQILSVKERIFPEGTFMERRENFMPYYDETFTADLVNSMDVFNKSIVMLEV